MKAEDAYKMVKENSFEKLNELLMLAILWPLLKEDFAQQRAAYMADTHRAELLASQAEAKNQECLDLPVEDELDR